MRNKIVSLAFLAFFASFEGEAWARSVQEAKPEVLSRLLACRTISDTSARLACFDVQAVALDQAERRQEVVVVDRSQIRKTRRSLFGLDLPDFSLFGGADKAGKGSAEEEGISRLESEIAQASQGPTGRWTIILKGGARWLQIDTRDLARLPRAGMPIIIRRATMGSYLASIDKQIGIRVRRIN